MAGSALQWVSFLSGLRDAGSRGVVFLSLEGILFFKIRDQVLLSNVELLNGQVGWHVNYFNTVDQRSEHVGDRIACADKDALAHVELKVEVTVSKLV